MLGEKRIKYLGFGSPLMDIIGDVDSEMIQKYELIENYLDTISN